MMRKRYHKRLACLEGAQIMTLAEYGKMNKISHSNLINKATRQTIEAFLEKGVWKIGVAQKNNLTATIGPIPGIV